MIRFSIDTTKAVFDGDERDRTAAILHVWAAVLRTNDGTVASADVLDDNGNVIGSFEYDAPEPRS